MKENQQQYQAPPGVDDDVETVDCEQVVELTEEG